MSATGRSSSSRSPRPRDEFLGSDLSGNNLGGDGYEIVTDIPADTLDGTFYATVKRKLVTPQNHRHICDPVKSALLGIAPDGRLALPGGSRCDHEWGFVHDRRFERGRLRAAVARVPPAHRRRIRIRS